MIEMKHNFLDNFYVKNSELPGSIIPPNYKIYKHSDMCSSRYVNFPLKVYLKNFKRDIFYIPEKFYTEYEAYNILLTKQNRVKQSLGT